MFSGINTKCKLKCKDKRILKEFKQQTIDCIII